MQSFALTVKQLNTYVKSLIEGDTHLASVMVTGEISNFKNHYASGHFYFTLKDKDASIRCVMFRANAMRVSFVPEDGVAVFLRGRVSLYEKDGQYQFYAEEMQPVGLGNISLQFEQIKRKLESEGLFDAEHKRPLPRFPENIAVVTSETGAAVQDIISILGRRYPVCRVILCPVAVQGEAAVPEMILALDKLYLLDTPDLIIIGRGGGSVEDLWPFNSEELARKIYESPVPVISAVGHETDFTICDFVADLRAPTPSAAAELAVPDISELKAKISTLCKRMANALTNDYNYNKIRLERLLNTNVFKRPVEALVYNLSEEADSLFERLCGAVKKHIEESENKFENLAIKLDALSPLKVLSRGYSVTEKDGRVVFSAKQLNVGDTVTLRFADDRAVCRVLESQNEENNYE